MPYYQLSYGFSMPMKQRFLGQLIPLPFLSRTPFRASNSAAGRPAHLAYIRLILITISAWNRFCAVLRCRFSLLSGSGSRGSRTAGPREGRDPSFDCGAQLGKTVTLGYRTLDNRVADHRTLGRDRDRKSVAGAARLWRLTALSRGDL